MLGQGKSLQQSSEAVGIDVKTGRKYRDMNTLPSEMKKSHTWRTREDVFKDDWKEIKDMLNINPGLEGKTILEWFIARAPEKYQNSHLRTLQRRIKMWRATEGPDKEIMFPQLHYPGELSQSDFTHMDDLGVMIRGELFRHLLYHFVLTYSNWETVSICYSESFESLSEDFQNALWTLGAVPRYHQTDRLTAAVNSPAEREQFKGRYQSLLDHYGVAAKAINRASPNENGDVEQSHYRFKKAVDQALMLRGNRNFSDLVSYRHFLQTVTDQKNKGRKKKFDEEWKTLGSLPQRRINSYRILQLKVGPSSTIRVNHNIYSVPSRLIGERIKVYVKASTLELYYGSHHLETYPRLRGENKQRIEYRHLIDSLIRKPGAFYNYRYREELYPNSFFRLAWDSLQKTHPTNSVKIYLNILYLAANNSEERISGILEILLRHHMEFTIENIEKYLEQPEAAPEIPHVNVRAVDLSDYDKLVKRWQKTSTNCLKRFICPGSVLLMNILGKKPLRIITGMKTIWNVF